MLYLIGCIDYMKIGYCNDGGLKSRMDSYETTNPYYKLLSTADGNGFDEKMLHHRLARYRYKNKEWFTNRTAAVKVWLEYDNNLVFYPDSFEDDVITEQYVMKLDIDMMAGLAKQKDIFTALNDDIEEHRIEKEFKKDIEAVKSDLFNLFEKSCYFQTLFRLYCDYRDQHPELEMALRLSSFIPDRFDKYYSDIGSPRLKALEYIEKNILNEYKINNFNSNISIMVQDMFFENNRYTNKYLKNKLQKIYNSLELIKTAKASDMRNYYIVKRVAINVSGSYVEGLELIKKK